MTRQCSDESYHHGDLKNALVSAGLSIVEEQGIKALSLRACAARAEVSHAAPKNHFENLAGLITAIATRGFRQFAVELRASIEAAPAGDGSNCGPGCDAFSRLQSAAVAYVGFAQSNPQLYQLMYSPEMFNREDPDLIAAACEGYNLLQELAASFPNSGSGNLPGNLAGELLVWSLVHGFAHLSIHSMLGPTVRELGLQPTILDVFSSIICTDQKDNGCA